MKLRYWIVLALLGNCFGVSPTITSFNTGQVSPLLEARTDFQKYGSSSRTIENMFVATQGPAFRRPGTKYIATQKSSSAAGRAVGYEHSVDDAYILVFENQVIRFFRDGGQILDNVGTEDISSAAPDYTIDAVNTTAETFTISDDGDLSNSFGDGTKFRVNGSTGNDATWTVSSTSFSSPNFVITVTGNITDATVDGTIGHIVAHWLLNDIDGTNVVDDDGATHDGTASTSILTLATTGKVGAGSFDLDGQYTVTVTDSADFSFTDNSNDTAFSIACWGFVTRKNDVQALLSKWRDGSTTREWRLSLANDRKLQLHLTDSSADLTTNRVAQWNLNDSAANTVVVDADGATHNGDASSNTSTLSVTGQISNAFDLDGSDQVAVTDHSDFTFVTAGDDIAFSISAWVFVPSSVTSLSSIISKFDLTSSANREWEFVLRPGRILRLLIYDQSALASQFVDSNVAIDTGWQHVVCTYAGSGGTSAADGMTLYVAGSAVASTTGSAGGTYADMEDKGSNVVIGDDADSSSTYPDKLDSIIVFQQELSLAEVSILWNDGSGLEDLAGANNTISAISDSAVDFGWHFLASTYSAPADEAAAADGIILYVDGAAVSSAATNSTAYVAMQDGAEEVRIGSQRNSGDSANEKFWQDKIDEVSVYSDVLTPTEVASLYSTTPFEVTSPYLSADLFSLAFAQSQDILYIDHPDYEPRQLTRTGDVLWDLATLDIDDGPFQNENLTSTTITPSATTGDITLTASAELFDPGHVGSIWRLDEVRDTSTVSGTFDENETSLSTPSFSGRYGFTTSGNTDGTITLQRSTNDGASWRPALTALTDTDFDNPAEIEEDTAIYRAVMSDFGSGTPTYSITITDNTNKGVVEITGVTDGTNATATVKTDLIGTSAITTWREGYWSDFRGWPEAVAVHQQRLTFGGSASFPQTVWFGKQDPDDYTNFLAGTLDTSAFTIALEGNNPIQWLLSQEFLLIGTSGSIGKWGEQGEAVTPTSPNYQEQTRHGAASIRAIAGGDDVLYVERGDRVVRRFGFDLQADKFLTPPLTVLSPEITASGIVDIAFQLRPEPILWCVLDDGEIATLTYQRDQSVVAWTKQITDGSFESVAVIPGDIEDEVWVTAARTINSSTARYVEQFQPQEWGSDDNDAWFVDSGLSRDGVAQTTFSGLDHLEAETVSIYADLLIESPEVVSSGSITIDNAASRVLAGMAYTSKLETLPLAIDPQDRAQNKKVRAVDFDLYRTGALKYGNGANATLETINFKNDLDADNTATAQDLYTSVTSFKHVAWPYGSTKKQTIYVESAQPMPLTVRSISTAYKLYGN